MKTTSSDRIAGLHCELVLATPMRPGAIAIMQLVGDVEPVLTRLTGRSEWAVARSRLCALRDIDDAVVARIGEDIAQIMPHGGPRVVQRLRAVLVELGVAPVAQSQVDPARLYPEASDAYEAMMLAALARAQSPLAIDLLLDQPQRWRSASTFTAEDAARSMRLNRLIDPPTVVVAGPPNVGKSTLSNRLMGRAMSIDADMPGTTRDYTTGRLNLGGLVVNWFDTPGLRATDDAIETEAIRLAGTLLDAADFIIAMTDNDCGWPALPRVPDLRLANKCDTGRRDDAELSISSVTGQGINHLVSTVRDRLLPPADVIHPGPWRFDQRLQPSTPLKPAP